MSLEKHVVLSRAKINTRKEKDKSGCSFVDANSYTLTTTNCLFSGFHGKWSKAYHSAQDRSSPLHIYLATIYCQQQARPCSRICPCFCMPAGIPVYALNATGQVPNSHYQEQCAQRAHIKSPTDNIFHRQTPVCEWRYGTKESRQMVACPSRQTRLPS